MKNITGLFLAVCVLFSNAVLAPEFQINTYTPTSQVYSSVASDGTNYLVTWHSYL